ncbi:probable calcium-binding protein CML41 isoform X1 [Brassica napus]|uniref:probable calcium-binding protein CML41 isoform X1 n=1 Tax=Brassica napus TaxID=3708 RepID=UPI0006AA9A0D|nr:probable calcium-binding protein CML41 isoform X1 [Brassica napus]
MATPQDKLSSKSLKWFSTKALKLNLSFQNRRGSSPKSNSSSSLNSPRRNTDDKNNTKSHHSHDELRRVFSHFDVNSDGKISAFELRDYFGSVGEYITHEAAQEAINEVDTDADGSLGFEDFVGLMTRRDLDGNGDGGGELKTAFEMFEVEKGSGCITPKGLQNMLTKLGESRTYGECEAMINYYDIDGNGVLDYHEFRQMMTV